MSLLASVLAIVGSLSILAGASLALLAAVGVLRLPDVLLRMNAATKASGLGAVCILVGVAAVDPSLPSTLTLALAAVLLLVTAPVAAHVVGHAAYRAGVPLWPGTARDDAAAPSTEDETRR